MSAMMTALFGGTAPQWQSREVPVPEPGPGQVLVRARAVALNNADVQQLDGSPAPGTVRRQEYLAGYEFAGDIAATGPGADGVHIGDRVMGTTQGAFAQYVLADHRHIMPIPESLGYDEASALPTGLLTEHGALTRARFRSGRSVLITGATSGIGLIGVQMAKATGAAHVIATTRSPAKEALLRQSGADSVVVTDGHDLTQAVLDATGGEGADVVLDHVGGQIFAGCLPATRVDGHVVNIGRLDGPQATIDLDALSYRHLHVRGVSFGFSRPEALGRVVAAAVEAVMPAVADHRIRPVVDSVHAFDRAHEAANRMRSHQAFGKIVLTVP
ncbi:quinone oxidoreductase family protein [Streptomyces sp. NBC_00385]|uniref:quinone oxidoreductase family protein n=1 Tax=Streptomyces sp. NBC_00385 TaxID=2975733 RepID=UPI002DDB9612|nr:zinc-binding dehydrogenase [Streptomyces sp. NBC_00385]WRZ08398.1 zinc-binding dehydrogenase [Streptomyces sp. NBC_00385]